MENQSLNEAEWRNPDNWSGPRLISIYFSKRDTRTWVPKQMPSIGWTLNLGRPAAVWWLFGFMLSVPLICSIISIIVCSTK